MWLFLHAYLLTAFITDRRDANKYNFDTHTLMRICLIWPMDTEGTVSSPYPPCDIIMPHFSQHKKDDDVWYSQPFYSRPGGYKLCLCVYPNGAGSFKDTHVSVFVYLMKGENDPQLQWPFEYDVTCGILNWKRDENHVIYTVHFTKCSMKCKARVESAERSSTGYGEPEVLSHALLYDSSDEQVQYLDEDCLCLQVVKVEPPK